MKRDEYFDLMNRIEISDKCRDKLLNADLDSISGNADEVNEPVEVIRRSQWYRTPAFAASIFAVIAVGALAFGVTKLSPSRTPGIDADESGTVEYSITEVSEVPITICTSGEYTETEANGIYVQAADVSETGLTLRIRDTSGGDHTYGENFSLQKLKNGGFIDLEPIIEDYGFNSIGYRPNENGELEIRYDWECLYGKLGNGTYRIKTYAVGGGRPEYFSAQFSITLDTYDIGYHGFHITIPREFQPTELGANVSYSAQLDNGDTVYLCYYEAAGWTVDISPDIDTWGTYEYFRGCAMLSESDTIDPDYKKWSEIELSSTDVTVSDMELLYNKGILYKEEEPDHIYNYYAAYGVVPCRMIGFDADSMPMKWIIFTDSEDEDTLDYLRETADSILNSAYFE